MAKVRPMAIGAENKSSRMLGTVLGLATALLALPQMIVLALDLHHLAVGLYLSGILATLLVALVALAFGYFEFKGQTSRRK